MSTQRPTIDVLARAGTARRDRPVALVAEGDPSTERLLVETLRHRGYEVVAASDPAATLAHCRRGGFDAALLDHRLAGSNGTNALRSLRETDPDRRTHVILVGDGGDAPRVESAISDGADDFLLRPIHPDVLGARLRIAERTAERNRSLLEANRRLELTNRTMRHELRSAARVQQALLPQAGFRVPGVEMAWRLRPCTELAGDILNCLRVDEHHLAFYVLDVSGHGVSAALLSAQVSRLMSPLISQSELLKERLSEPPWYRVVDPPKVVRKLNALFPADEEMTHYFTIVYGTYHVASRHLRFAVGGHPGPWLTRPDGSIEPVDARSHPVGLFDDMFVFEGERTLEPGERLWCFSDGLLEAADPEGRMLAAEGLTACIAAQRDVPVVEAADRVMGGVERWCRPGSPGDDCTVLVIEAC